jgi:pyrimidine-specific ribonucleoside hydrolase
MRNIIIDCDPGHDDVIAFLVALANQEELNILGITTVAGNQTLAKVTNNILKVQDFLGIHIPVSMGYSTPMVKELDVQPQAHGATGMDGPNIPEPTSKPTGMHAIEFMKKTLMEAEEKVTMVCIGPLTNMALFLKTYPELREKIDCIAIMGGGVNNGNTLIKAEFNIYHDPDAAKIVFDSGVKIVLAPLEVCYAASILLTETEKFAQGGRVSHFVYDLMKFYQGYAVRHGWDRTAIFDAVPVTWLIHPEFFTAKEYEAYIETDGRYCRGMTVIDTRNYQGELNNPKTVLIDADREKFIGFLFECIGKLDRIYG